MVGPQGRRSLTWFVRWVVRGCLLPRNVHFSEADTYFGVIVLMCFNPVFEVSDRTDVL